MTRQAPSTPDVALLETFPNPSPENDYVIRIRVPEFTCLCPKTGQPDFATLIIEYVAAESCIELKSLKTYIWAFRAVGAFHEAVTNRILADLAGVLSPRFLRVSAQFNVRGGIYTTITAQYKSPAWTPAVEVHLDRPTPFGD